MEAEVKPEQGPCSQDNAWPAAPGTVDDKRPRFQPIPCMLWSLSKVHCLSSLSFPNYDPGANKTKSPGFNKMLFEVL